MGIKNRKCNLILIWIFVSLLGLTTISCQSRLNFKENFASTSYQDTGGDGEVFDGKITGTYYDLEEGYTCQLGDGTVISSYLNSITFDHPMYLGQPIGTGDACDSKEIPLNASDLDLSEILLGRIYYNGRLFESGLFTTMNLKTTGRSYTQNIAVSDTGSHYILGASQSTQSDPLNPNPSRGFTLYKTTESGDPIWDLEIFGADDVLPYGLALDSAENAYFGGRIQTPINTVGHEGRNDHYVAKVNSQGSIDWEISFGTSNNENVQNLYLDEPRGVLYVSGGSDGVLASGGGHGSFDFYVAQVNMNSGSIHWIYQNGSTGDDRANTISVLNNGEVLIGGHVTGSIDGQSFGGGTTDAYISKIDFNGNLVWSKLFGDSGDEAIESVIVDGNTIFVSGDSLGSGFGSSLGNYDQFFMALDENGNIIYQQQIGSSGWDDVTAAEKDGLGNVYILGYSNSDFENLNSPAGKGYTLTKVRVSDGYIHWARHADFVMEGLTGRGVSYDSKNNRILVYGYEGSDVNESNQIVFVYDASGNLIP